MIGNEAPLHVVTDSAFMLGEAAIPVLTIILGANLLQGLKGTGIQLRVILGIVVTRYVLLPLFGILIVKGALQAGLVPSNNKLFIFLLLLQYAMPPAINLGAILGWMLVKVTKPPKHLKGLIIGACSAGNMGNLPIILIPAMCKEKGSPFGATDVCETYALSYASLSMAIGAVYLWSFVYNVIRISAEEVAIDKDAINYSSINIKESNQEPLLPCSEDLVIHPHSKSLVSLPVKIHQRIRTFLEKANLKAVFAPSTIAAILGFTIGMVSPIQKLMIGNDAPLHVVNDSAFMLGEAAIPARTIILGANLLKGLKGTSIQLRVILGIVVTRYVILPLLGILIVKGALQVGIVPSDDKLFVFLLHIQYAMPPAMNIGTMTQLFGSGQNECSVVFFVFGPALVGSNLAKTVTIKTFLTLWFMLVNILLTFVLGSAMGWVLAKFTKASKHVKGLILASCSAGNLGNMPIIILPAMCKEKGSPFGAPDVCERYGLAYASLSMAIGTVYFWLYAYNIVRITSKEAIASAGVIDETLVNVQPQGEPPLHSSDDYALEDPGLSNSSKSMVKSSSRVKQCLRIISKEFNLKAILAPSTIGAMVGFFIGTIAPLRKLLMDNTLHVVGDTSFMIGHPLFNIDTGANLLRGLKGSGIRVTTIVGIIAVRYIFLPLLGILVVKGAVLAGFVQSHDIFLQFVLLLQFALPPAVSISTVTELFGAGQNECSVIMLWTNVLAPITLTL
uniref:Uncharacterized protein n=1 Tax=Chenopodium quinoa TaxID=63459 RepID=A0A803KWC2_CHEQI